MSDCTHCNECVTEFCLREVQCVYSCGCCCTIPVKVAPNLSLMAGTVMAQRQSDELWVPFDPNADDGSQIPRGVLRYDVNTDSNSRMTNFVGPWNANCGPMYTNVYFCGTFRIEETVGNLSAALSHPSFGHLLEGFIGGSGTWSLM